MLNGSLSLFILLLLGLLLVSVTAVFATPDLPPSPMTAKRWGHGPMLLADISSLDPPLCWLDGRKEIILR